MPLCASCRPTLRAAEHLTDFHLHTMCFVHDVQNGLALTQTAGQPALSLAISAAAPAVQAAQGNSGHPELVQFVKNRAAGANALTLTFTPNWFANGNSLAS